MAKIPRNAVIPLIDRYKELRAPLEKDSNGNDKTESIYTWYSVDDILAFLLDNGFRKTTAGGVDSYTPPDSKTFSGIRIYQGIHDTSFTPHRNGSNDPASTVECMNYNTVIIVATRAAEQADLFECQNPDRLGDYHKEVFNDDALSIMGSVKYDEEKQMLSAIDYATLCPPNCNHVKGDLAKTEYDKEC